MNEEITHQIREDTGLNLNVRLKQIIKEELPALTASKEVYVDRFGMIHFTGDFIIQLSKEVLGDSQVNGKLREEQLPTVAKAPEAFHAIKLLVEDGEIKSAIKLKRLYDLGNELSIKFTEEVFAPGKAPKLIQKKDGRMSVYTWNQKGKEAFAKVIANPIVEWDRLVKSTIYAYTKGVDFTTGTISNYFINDKWVAYYEMEEQELSNLSESGMDPRWL